MKVFAATVLSLCALGFSASPAAGQLPAGVSQGQLSPDVIRQRIRESGLSADQIRSRLRASGYPDNLLDAYLGAGAPPAGAQPGTAELSAIQALGFGPLGGSQQPLDTGMIRWRGDTLAFKSNVFGVDVFRRSTTQFLPLLAGPVPPDYHLGPRDVLVLILTGDVELAYTLQVTREGFVFIPQVGQVFVSSLTLEQLRDVLYTRLGRVYSGVKRSANATTRFDISVANVRANQIFVVGEVAQQDRRAEADLIADVLRIDDLGVRECPLDQTNSRFDLGLVLLGVTILVNAVAQLLLKTFAGAGVKPQQ